MLVRGSASDIAADLCLSHLHCVQEPGRTSQVSSVRAFAAIACLPPSPAGYFAEVLVVVPVPTCILGYRINLARWFVPLDAASGFGQGVGQGAGKHLLWVFRYPYLASDVIPESLECLFMSPAWQSNLVFPEQSKPLPPAPSLLACCSCLDLKLMSFMPCALQGTKTPQASQVSTLSGLCSAAPYACISLPRCTLLEASALHHQPIALLLGCLAVWLRRGLQPRLPSRACA